MEKSANSGGLWTMEFGELGATLREFGIRGVTRKHFALIRSDKSYADKVASAMLDVKTGIDFHYEEAAKIVDIFGPNEWTMLMGMKFSKKQIKEIADFPWSKDILNAKCPFSEGRTVGETHFAFLGMESYRGAPLNALNLILLIQRASLQSSYLDWIASQDFAVKKTCEFRWYLMPKEVPHIFRGKFYDNQLEILPSEYYAASVAEYTAKIALSVKKKRDNFSSLTAFCADKAIDGRRISVAFSKKGLTENGKGFEIDKHLHNYRSNFMGLAISRKLPEKSIAAALK